MEIGLLAGRNRPKLSIVLPTYQRADLLREVVSQLLDQSLGDFEMFVMDDGSSDGTEAMMRTISDSRLRYVRKGRLGVPGIVNAGFDLCLGEYIMICHDHDSYEKSLLERLSCLLDRYPSAGFAFCAYTIMDPSGQTEIRRDIHDFPECMPGKQFLKHHLLPRVDSCVASLSMIRRSALEGRFMDPAVGGSADVELWHRLAASWDVVYVREALIRIRGRDGFSQFSGATLDLTRRVLRAKEKYIEHIGDKRAQRAVRRRWSRTIDASCMSCYLGALESGNAQIIPEIASLLREYGSRIGHYAFVVFQLLPQRVILWALKVIRKSIHFVRHVRVLSVRRKFFLAQSKRQ